MTHGEAEQPEPVDKRIAGLLFRAAARLPDGADLERFGDYMHAGMWPQAHEELRAAAAEHPMPFAFWVEMSQAADLMGLE